MIKEAIQLPPTNSAQGRIIQKIVIFDDHPESLRLVFGSATPKIDLPSSDRASSRHVILFSLLFIGLVIAILWPLL